MSPRRLAPIAGVAASLLLVAACGDGTEPSSSPTTAPATTQAPTTVATTTPTIGLDEARTVFKTFFDNFKGDPTLLEDGEALTAGIESLRSNPAAATVTMTVKDVKALDTAACEAAAVAAPCAQITYDLGVGDNPAAVAGQTGYLVQQAGKWKVAKTTFCTLAGMGGNAPKEC